METQYNRTRFWLAASSLLLISYSVLSFEVSLTRVFSVMLSYHFVFAIVSGALLGLGIGAIALRKWRNAMSASPAVTSAILFALLVAVSLLAIIKLVPFLGGAFWLYLILAILPFGAAGFTVSWIFQEFPARSPFLYGADLIGAALGALTVVPLLDAFGGVNAVLFAAVTAAVGALLLGLSRAKLRIFAAAALFSLAALFGVLTGMRLQISVPVTNDPNKEMYQMLSNPEFKAKIVESRWSSFGRTDVVKSDLFPNEMTLFVDGAAGSAMYKAEAIMKDPQEMAHLTLHYGEFFPFLSLKDDDKKNALIIGPGGGRDVVVALLGGVRQITAVEVNPDVVKIVKDYKEWNGGLYSPGNPRVTTVVAEGRNFVRNASSAYDLIMLAIPITKSSRSVEGYALTENYLFTVEAFSDYLNHLSRNGRIIIVAHENAEIYKLISLAAGALEKQGISEQDSMKRIYTVAADMMPAVVIQKQPLSPEEANAIHQQMHSMGFDKGAFYVPYQRQIEIPPSARIGVNAPLRMFDQFLVSVAEGKLSLARLAASASMDIGPVVDDRPFFYKFERGLPSPFGVFSFIIVVALVWLLGLALLRKRPNTNPATFTGALREKPVLKRFLLLFAALGIAYMLIEISLFQKLMLFIDQPQRALTVLLFALLLGGGLGSILSSIVRRKAARTVALLSMAIALAVVALSVFFAPLYQMGLSPRLTSMAVLIPLGILMGFPFPLGMRLTAEYGLSDHVSVLWGVNGIASVLGSALSIIVGILVGFSWALYLGAALYILVAFLLYRMPASPAPKGLKARRA
jgi:spermidine synthase